MAEKVSSRHEGRIDGINQSNPEENARTVAILWDEAVAGTRAGQLALFTLCNSLARMQSDVSGICLVGPDDMEILERVNPWRADGCLRRSLAALISSIDAVPLLEQEPSDTIRVCLSGDAIPQADYYVYCNGWVGGVSKAPREFDGRSKLPFAPYAAAFLTIGEIFKDIRIGYGRPALSDIYYSLWSFRASSDDSTLESPSEDVSRTLMRQELAGVGAVGMVYATCLWSVPGLEVDIFAVDGDPKGVDVTNLNRYWLTDRSSITEQKAFLLKDKLGAEGYQVKPVQDMMGNVGKRTPLDSFGICALDSNTARIDYMKRYLPRMFRGSTFELRAEVVRAGPPGQGQCLACGLAPEPVFTESEQILNFKAADEAQQREWCNSVGVDYEEAKTAIESTECSSIKEAVLLGLPQSDQETEAEWSVVFVSGLCGTILAALSFRELIGNPLDGTRVVFQFHNPVARSNAPDHWPRHEECSCCMPGSVESGIWEKRYLQFSELQISKA